MKALEIKAPELKIVRTTSHLDTVVNAVPYETTTGLKGIQFTLAGLPYPVRILTKQTPAMFIKSKVEFRGVMREYQGKEYFDAKDVKIVEQSAIGLLAISGVAYAGAI